MPQGNARVERAAVALETYSEHCPWRASSPPQTCHHVAVVDNQRGDKIEDVNVHSKRLHGYVSLSGREEVLVFFAVISSGSKKAAFHGLGITQAAAVGQTEEILTTATFFDSTQKEEAQLHAVALTSDDLETLKVSYELDIV